MIIITVTGNEAATNLDVLQGTRLQTVPSNGILAIEMQATLNNATNGFLATLNLPNGDTPWTTINVPAGGLATGGEIDARLAYRATFTIGQGGHCVFDFTEVGTAIAAWRVTFKGRG